MTERLGIAKGRLTSLVRLSYLAPGIVGALLSSPMKKSRFDQAGSGVTAMTSAAICASPAATTTTTIA